MNLPFVGNSYSCGQKHNFPGHYRVSERSRRVRETVQRKHAFLIALLTVALLAAIPKHVAAQASTALARITTRVDDSVVTTLHGNTHPLARPANDRGAVADSLPMHRMLLLLQRGPDQESALRTLIDQQQSSTSPNYRQWLTPQQFGQQFGPSDADIQTVTSWLSSHGFQVAKVSTGRTVIEFSGTAGQVNSAFHTQIHSYTVNGKQYYANNADPQIPTALTPVVAGAVSLHNFPRKAQSHVVGTFRKTTTTGQVTPLNPHAAPLYTFGCTSSAGNVSTCNALGPGDFATIYNIEKLWNPGVSATKIDGTGQTIAIVGDSEICTQNSPDWNTSYIGPNNTTVTCNSDDVATFRTLFGLPAKAPNVILDGPDPGFNSDEIEGDLDVQWSGAVAKNATIDFVIAENTEATAGTDLAAEYVVDNNLAPILSESFGTCEQSLGPSGNEFEATLWEQAAAQGITVIVSAGDSGSAGCDDPNTQGAAQNGPAVNGIASTPFNVALGGTDFDTAVPGYPSSYWGSNTTDAIGTNDVSATSYIPETTWNDSCAQNFTGLLTGCNTLTNGGIVGGGGGQSNCSYEDNTGCYYYPKPSWQTVASGSGLSVANDITRDLPDVSLFAADGYVSNSFYVVCEADFNLPPAPCSLSTNNFFDFIGVGGTSSAAPTFAGMMALVNQNMAVNHPSLSNTTLGARQGNANYVLYNLAKSQSPSNCNSSAGPIASCTFNDITKGNNSVPCFGGSFSCSNTSIASGAYGVVEPFSFTTGAITNNLAWSAASGLDLATGLGSVNAYNLVTNWPTSVGAFIPTTPTLCLSTTATTLASCSGPINITHGQTVYVNVTVNGPGSTPIPVTENFNVVPQIVEDVALVGTFPGGNPGCNVAGCNTGGVDHFTSNNYVIANANIYPLTSGTTVGLNYSTNALVGGTYNVIAHYAGDGTYGASDSTSPISVTVAPEASTASVSVGTVNPTTGNIFVASSVPYGDINLVRVDVVGTSGQQSATGTVTLTDNGIAIVNPTGSTSPSFSLNTEGYLEDQTTFLAVGSHSFVAKYNGDASYTASSNSGAAALTVTQAATTTTLTTSATSVASTANIILTAFVDTLSQGANPTGTVSFFNNGTLISTVPNSQLVAMFDSNGFDGVQAVLTTKLSASGSITATYSGDTNYMTSTTATGVSVTVTGPAALTVTSTTASLPIGVVNVTYPSTQLTAGGGTPPYTWTVTTGSLPNGFNPLSSSGLITGAPAAVAVGTTNFTVQVKDSAATPATSTANLSITVNPVFVITTSSRQLAIGAVGSVYPSTTLVATGGVPASGNVPYIWTLISGSLPTGFNPLSTAGVISGTPSATGTFNFTVQAQDSEGNTTTQALTITVNPKVQITTTSAAFTTGVVNVPYPSVTLAATGGVPPYATWSITTGALPTGLTLNAASGLISGTPTASGTFNFTVQVKDTQGYTATANLSIIVDPALGVTTTTASLPTGVVNKPYPSTQLTAVGGVSPYTWTITAGSLPTGFGALPMTGLISGTPTATGAFPFTIQVKDSLGNTSTASLTITINASLQITTSGQLAAAQAGVSYSAALAATGGVLPYTWAPSTGSTLPPGLSLNPSTGAITGTPTAAAVQSAPYTFTVKVTDSESPGITATSGTLSITVNGLSFTTSASPINLSIPGQSGSQLITLGGTGITSSVTVTLSCAVTGSPAGAVDLPTCSFSTPGTNFSAPNIITLSNTATTGTATLNIASTAVTSALYRLPSNGPSGRNWPLAYGAISIVCFLLMLCVPKQRRWAFAPLAVLLVMVVVAGVGCGGGGTSSGGGGSTGNPGTTQGAYTITITATPSTGAAQMTTVTVNVQ